MFDPTKRRYPHPRAKEKPQQTVGGAKSHLESNATPTREARRAQTKSSVHQETPQRLIRPAFECLSVSCGGTGQHGLLQGHRLWVQQSWVWQKPSRRRLPITPQKSHQNLYRTWGNRLLEGTNKTLCTPRPRRKEQ